LPGLAHVSGHAVDDCAQVHAYSGRRGLGKVRVGGISGLRRQGLAVVARWTIGVLVAFTRLGLGKNVAGELQIA
jgi:hypothetical protein